MWLSSAPGRGSVSTRLAAPTFPLTAIRRRNLLRAPKKPQSDPSFELDSAPIGPQVIRRNTCPFRIFGMAFFKRELSPVERFESALKTRQAEREGLASELAAAEKSLFEKKAAAERLAVAGAASTKLERAEA